MDDGRRSSCATTVGIGHGHGVETCGQTRRVFISGAAGPGERVGEGAATHGQVDLAIASAEAGNWRRRSREHNDRLINGRVGNCRAAITVGDGDRVNPGGLITLVFRDRIITPQEGVGRQATADRQIERTAIAAVAQHIRHCDGGTDV